MSGHLHTAKGWWNKQEQSTHPGFGNDLPELMDSPQEPQNTESYLELIKRNYKLRERMTYPEDSV